MRPRYLLQVAALAAFITMSLTGCSVDFVPIHYSRVNALKSAKKPLQRGPNAPGAFRRQWLFQQPVGFLFDPSRIGFDGGAAKLKAQQRDAVLETETGFPYGALDTFHDEAVGLVRYQLSSNGARWYYHNGMAWTEAERSSGQTNSAAEVNAHISTFHTEVGVGIVQLKAFLMPGAGPSPAPSGELKSVTLEGIAPQVDGWN